MPLPELATWSSRRRRRLIQLTARRSTWEETDQRRADDQNSPFVWEAVNDASASPQLPLGRTLPKDWRGPRPKDWRGPRPKTIARSGETVNRYPQYWAGPGTVRNGPTTTSPKFSRWNPGNVAGFEESEGRDVTASRPFVYLGSHTTGATVAMKACRWAGDFSPANDGRIRLYLNLSLS